MATFKEYTIIRKQAIRCMTNKITSTREFTKQISEGAALNSKTRNFSERRNFLRRIGDTNPSGALSTFSSAVNYQLVGRHRDFIPFLNIAENNDLDPARNFSFAVSVFRDGIAIPMKVTFLHGEDTTAFDNEHHRAIIPREDLVIFTNFLDALNRVKIPFERILVDQIVAEVADPEVAEKLERFFLGVFSEDEAAQEIADRVNGLDEAAREEAYNAAFAVYMPQFDGLNAADTLAFNNFYQNLINLRNYLTHVKMGNVLEMYNDEMTFIENNFDAESAEFRARSLRAQRNFNGASYREQAQTNAQIINRIDRLETRMEDGFARLEALILNAR